ncbi:MAG TPA: carboxymuconolactone decarboxylase family protein [Longimicrobiales bacterium]
MGEETRALVALSAALSSGSAERVSEAMARAARVAVPGEVEEVLLQSYLFLGYPAALSALAQWRELTGLPAPAAAEAEPREGWERRGEWVCARIYGDQYDRLRANVARLHPDLERWMVTEGYGKVLGRPGLALEVRELCVVALLAGLDAPRQLYAHLRGALNAGADPAEVEEALRVASEVVPRARAEAAWSVWSMVRSRWEARWGAPPGDASEDVR